MIRSMQKSDKSSLIKILRSTHMFTREEIDVAIEQMDLYLKYKKSSDYTLIVVENEGLDVVGFMSYGPAPMAKGVFNLYWIAVIPSAQNHGYGREMIAWLLKRIKTPSARMILVETSSLPKYKPTCRFYRSLGFRMVCRLPNYYSVGHDLIIFAKILDSKEKISNGRMESAITARH